jgi:NH3-dependent NAD+ synthetase
MEISSTHTLTIADRSGSGGIRFVCTTNPEGEIVSFEEHDRYQGGPMTTPMGLEPGEFLLQRVRDRSCMVDEDVASLARFLKGIEKRAAALSRFETLVFRLVGKMKLSRAPVPGFIVGLSGTDSILGFVLVYEAAKRMGMASRVLGVHYVGRDRRKPTWFEEAIVPWLRERCPEATILVETPFGGNEDQLRWADLHMRALNEVSARPNGDVLLKPLGKGRNYWVVGCQNLTEQELGKYSAMSEKVSVAPIRKVWKSRVIAMCEVLDVPAIAIENSRLPDCLCGRDDIAANNIELIDDILTCNVKVEDHDPALLDMMFAYVRDLKEENGFKQRTPYLL